MLEFRRITSQKRFIPQIDGLRFVAISSVVMVHIWDALERGAVAPPFPVDSDIAKRGVELFFVISGFILGVPFASRYLLNAPKVNLSSISCAASHAWNPPTSSAFLSAHSHNTSPHAAVSAAWRRTLRLVSSTCTT